MRYVALILVLTLTGCAGYASDYDQYAQAYSSHQARVSTTVASLSVSSAQALDSISDPTAKALYLVLTQQQIAAVSTSPFQLIKPTTWTDFWNGLWPFLGQATPIVGMGYLGAKAIEGAGQVTFNGSSNTFAPLEGHITGSSQASMSIPYQSPPTTTNYATVP